MGWLRTIIGFVIGDYIMGPIGGLIGAVIANKLGQKDGGGLFGGDGASTQKGGGDRSTGRAASGGAGDAAANKAHASSAQQELVFLASAAAMMAKLAKADGHVSMSEIDSAEKAFKRLGLSPEKREFCILVFRRAKEDEHTIFEYAQSFAAAQPDRDIREIFYDILWELASADGTVSPAELKILDKITFSLRIRRYQFAAECAKHGVGQSGGSEGRTGSSGGGGARSARSEMSLTMAYRILGCSPATSDADLKKAYREKAKKYHPDELAAQGISPELIEKATARMAEINAAWSEIKKARGL